MQSFLKVMFLSRYLVLIILGNRSQGSYTVLVVVMAGAFESEWAERAGLGT